MVHGPCPKFCRIGGQIIIFRIDVVGHVIEWWVIAPTVHLVIEWAVLTGVIACASETGTRRGCPSWAPAGCTAIESLVFCQLMSG